MSAAIVQGDAFALLSQLADGSVDHVITDPPYTRRSTNARTTRKGAVATGTGGDARIATDVGAWDAATLARFAAECLRVSRRGGWVVIFCELESLGLFAEREEYVRSLVWDRHSTPQITGDRPAQPGEGMAVLHRDPLVPPPSEIARALRRGAEPDDMRFPLLANLFEDEEIEIVRRGDVEDPGAAALLHRKGRKQWNGGGKRGMYRHPVVRGALRVHPAQKPGDLIRDLVLDFTNEGDSILDPCCGVGTVPIVAAANGRTGVGFDRSRVWVRRAQLRAAGDAAWSAPLTPEEVAALDRGE